MYISYIYTIGCTTELLWWTRMLLMSVNLCRPSSSDRWGSARDSFCAHQDRHQAQWQSESILRPPSLIDHRLTLLNRWLVERFQDCSRKLVVYSFLISHLKPGDMHILPNAGRSRSLLFQHRSNQLSCCRWTTLHSPYCWRRDLISCSILCHWRVLERAKWKTKASGIVAEIKPRMLA